MVHRRAQPPGGGGGADEGGQGEASSQATPPHLAAPPRLESLRSREVVIEKGISNRALDPRLGRVPFQLRDFHMFLDIVRCRFLG